MKKRLSTAALSALSMCALAIALLLAACANTAHEAPVTDSDTVVSDTALTTTSSTTTTATTTTTTTASIQLSTSATSIYCHDFASLEVTYGTPERFVSSDPDVISVDDSGLMEAKSAGTAIISVYDSYGSCAQCTVESIKVAYITIDDFPNENTAAILDTLAQYDVKATFFLCGGALYVDELYQRIADEGHTIANHTYSHNMDFYYDYEQFIASVRRQGRMIEELTGQPECKLFRFPGGSNGRCCNINGGEFFRKLREEGYIIFDWTSLNCDAGDSYTAEACLECIRLYTTEDCEIILMHHTLQTAESLADTIEFLLEQGYTLATLTRDTTPVTHIGL